MKKIALVLALLMCLPFALFGCGKHSSPESCAKAYIKATYDFDYETIMDLTPRFDEGLMKKFDDDYTERDYDDFYKDAERDKKNDAEDGKEYVDDLEDYDVSYTITKTVTYKSGDDRFDSVVNPDLCAERLQPLYEAIDEIACVYYCIEATVLKDKGDDPDYYCNADKLTLAKIDGSWYIFDPTLPDYD